MSDPFVLVTQNAAVRTLTLNRPASLNAFGGTMHADLLAALDAAAADATVRAVVLTGAGRAFCAGQDLADPALAGSAAPDPALGVAASDLGTLVERWSRIVLRLRAMPVPVVAAVNGVAAGAGANLALACDMVLAARSASFIQAFSKIGLIPDSGGTWLLPRLVGRARALGLALLGERLAANEAQRIGLIWQCVDDSGLAAAAQALAVRLAALPVAALAATRQAFDAAQTLDLPAALAEEGRRQALLGAAADHREGVAAFREKRAARFGDR